MKVINIGKNVVKVTLVCLMLSLIFAGSNLKPLKADPSYFTLEAVVTDDPYWGYYGGYHDIWFALQTELAKIDITLDIEYNDMYGWWYKVWDDGWNYTGVKNPPDPEGWDLTMFEWWLQPHAVEPWFASMILNDQTPYEGGFNIHPWMNERADTLILKGLTSFVPETRKNYMWGWQEEWMHDPPIAKIYYPRILEPIGSYVVGYDPTGCWWYQVRHLDINETDFELTVGGAGYGGQYANPTRYAAGSDIIYYAISEDVWGWSPHHMDSYSEENFGTLVYDTLYTWSLNWTDEEWLSAGIVEPDPEDYIIEPELASGDPIPVAGNNSHLRIPLREGVYWNNRTQTPAHPRTGTLMNATDVKFTFDYALTLEAETTGMGDFAYCIDRVEVVPLLQGLGGIWCPYTEQYINQSAIDFHLKFPHPDIKSVLSNDWGGGSIIPWTQELQTRLENHPETMSSHKSHGNWQDMHPGTGPYIVTGYKENQYITMTRNDLYWGKDLGYGPHVSTIELVWAEDAAGRLLKILNNEIDMGEYPLGTVLEYQTLMARENIRIFEYNYPASNGVWFNFDNPYLSNRYVRQAIAHAIPYPYIISQILPGWGVSGVIQGKTYIMPTHYYEGECLFNTAPTCPPYEYDIAKATEYLNMWKYAQHAYAPNGTAEVALGPVGDANFDGVVNFDDFFILVKWIGLPINTWTWDPGCDIDPDFNNDESVTAGDDLPMWVDNWGNEYPFAGAR